MKTTSFSKACVLWLWLAPMAALATPFASHVHSSELEHAQPNGSSPHTATNLIPWTASPTGSNHIIILPATLVATWNGISLDPGDAIGFFFERNDSLFCSNFVIYQGQNTSLAVYGNDASLTDKNGFAPGERFNVKIFKVSTQQEQDAEAIFASIGTVIPPLTITSAGMYSINGISLLTQVSASTVIRPQTAFTANTVCGTLPLVVEFSDQSSHEPDQWYWDFGNGQISTVPQPTVTFAAPGIYSVQLITANAAGQDTLTRQSYITVVDAVSIALIPGDTICAGTRLRLLAAEAGSFQWTGQFLESNEGAETAATLPESGDYVFQVIGITNDCASAPAAVSVHVRPTPVVTLTASADTICLLDSILLSAVGADTYLWQGPNLNMPSGNQVVAMPDISGFITYSVLGTTGACVSLIKKVNIWVRPQQQIQVFSDRSFICLGDTLYLYALGADSIYWTGPGLQSDTGLAVLAIPQQAGEFVWQASGQSYGCQALGDSLTVVVDEQALSVTITVDDCPGPDLLFRSTVLNGGPDPNILWYLNGQVVSNGPEFLYINAQNGRQVYCAVSPVNPEPCTRPTTATSNTLTVNCIMSSLPELIPGLHSWSVSPNPGRGLFVLTIHNHEPIQSRMSLRDIMGRLIWTEDVYWPSGNSHRTVDFSALAAGSYQLIMQSGNLMSQKRLLIHH